MKVTWGIIFIWALTSFSSGALDKCKVNSDNDSLKILRELKSAQLRYVTNLQEDVGTCRSVTTKSFDENTKSAVADVKRLEPNQSQYTEYSQTTKVTECQSIVEIHIKGDSKQNYFQENVYSDYRKCLITRDPSLKPADPEGCRLWAMNEATDTEIEECKTHLEGCGEPTSVYNETCEE